jgi:superfamily II DNA helicase RecQ
VVILNTGGGKSLIFEMTHLLTGKTIVVIEPLIAIINDQTAKMLERKVKVVKLTPETDMDEAMKLAKEGKIGICTLTHIIFIFISFVSFLHVFVV